MAENQKSLPRFFTSEPCRKGAFVALAPSESAHLVRVLRAESGDRVRVFNGSGREFEGTIQTADPDESTVRVDREISTHEAPPTAVHLAFAPPKGDRSDFLVEKATELGVDRLIPLTCERTQASQAEQAAKRVDRWQRKTVQAAKQCHRSTLPQVLPPVCPAEFFVEPPGRLLVASTRAGSENDAWSMLAGFGVVPQSLCLVVGPEGGFTRRELRLARDSDARLVHLGRNILRLETAAIAFLSAVVLWLNARNENGA